MKKTLAMILAVSMVFGLLLTGCGQAKETAPASEPAAQEEAPAAEAAAPEEAAAPAEPAGEAEEVTPDNYLDGDYSDLNLTVGLILPTLAAEMLAVQAKEIPAYFAQNGVECIVTEAGTDADQISAIENFVAMGVDMIMAVVTNCSSVENAVNRARESGTKVVIMSEVPPYEVDGYFDLDIKMVAHACSDMFEAWIDKQFPDAEDGSIKAAFLTYSSVGTLQDRTDIIMETLESDPRIDLVFTKETDGIVEAADAVEEAFTTDPDIQLIIASDDGGAMGANQTWIARSDKDLENDAIFSAGYSPSLSTLISEAGTDTSLVRGAIVQGGAGMNYIYYSSSLQVLLGLTEPNTVFAFPIAALNSFGYIDEYTAAFGSGEASE